MVEYDCLECGTPYITEEGAFICCKEFKCVDCALDECRCNKEKFDCGDCGVYYWVEDRNNFKCPNCEDNEQKPPINPIKHLDIEKKTFKGLNSKGGDLLSLILERGDDIESYIYISSFGNGKVCYGVKRIYSNGISFKYCPFVLTASAWEGDILNVHNGNKKGGVLNG